MTATTKETTTMKRMGETSKEEIQRIRAEQDLEEAMADEVQARVGPGEWQAIIGFNQYCANKLGLTLEFYRRDQGQASYRFRPRTDAERQERAEDWTEDHI